MSAESPASAGSGRIIARLHVPAATPPLKIDLCSPGRLTLGRSDTADIALNDTGISRLHCALLIFGQTVTVEDLKSRAGTFVNNRAIADPMALQHGDVLTIGGTVFHFLSCSAEEEDTMLAPGGPAGLPRDQSDDTMIVRGRRAGPDTDLLRLPKRIVIGDALIIGRDPDCGLSLPTRDTSRRHAEITLGPAGYLVRDLGSTNGTYVDGKRAVGPVPLAEGGRLRVGAVIFTLKGDALSASSQKRNVRIRLQHISKTVISRDTGQSLKLLDNVSLVIEPNEFIALLGPSGSGKSTLMDAINGRRPATRGQVMVNDDDFYLAYDYYRKAIGYVPQQDIVHSSLTVEQALTFSARLRLPSDTSPPEIKRIVNEVVVKLGLQERCQTTIANLSGGQLKRVSLGVELIADPNLLFLDEATSGLDAGTEAKMMTLFRRIADEGKTVICITHNVENVHLCDLVVVLVCGKLAYYGPPEDMTSYFGVAKISEIYDRLEGAPVEEWVTRFERSDYRRHYVIERVQALAESESTPRDAASQRPPQPREVIRESLRQYGILVQRYATVTLQDRKNVAILLAQAPIIGLLLGLVFHSDGTATDLQEAGTHALVVFLLVVSAIWFGCTNAAKEVVKELPIYLRERAINLNVPAYLASKVVVLSALCVVQCLTLLAIVLPLTGLRIGFVGPLLTLCLTSLSGMMLGLLVSALVDNVDKATAIVPILLIPQVIFAGAIHELSGWALPIARTCIIAFWAFDAMLHFLPEDLRELKPAGYSFGADALGIVLLLLAFAGAAVYTLHRKDRHS